MLATPIVRGNVVTFTASFKDATGAPVVPTTVDIYLTWAADPASAQTLNMTLLPDNATFQVEWSTDGLGNPSLVFWSLRASDPSAAQDGSFTLTANAANPVA